MGDKMCLLEESEEGEIKSLICEAETWWKQWLRLSDHGRRGTSIAIVFQGYGSPECLFTLHVWNFFEKLANSSGVYVCSDEGITKRSDLDVARVLVRLEADSELPVTLKVNIDGKFYSLRTREEFTPLCRVTPKPKMDEDSELEDSISKGGFM